MKYLNVSKEEHDRIFVENYEGRNIHVFMSYSSKEKAIACSVKDSLERYGLSIFLAHEDIRPTFDWQKEIIQNLKKCDIFLPILTPSFRESEWTDQETGRALALGKFIVPLKVAINPYGFISRLQACNLDSKDIETSCLEIIRVIREQPSFREPLVDCLLRQLEKAPNFDVASDILRELKGSKTLTKEQANQVIRISIRNHQVRMCSEGQNFLKSVRRKYGSKIDPVLKQVYMKIRDSFKIPRLES